MFDRVLRLVSCLALIASARVTAAERSLADYARVEVPTAKTSIYVGTVTMTMPAFVRSGGSYEAAYAARVFPYFFYNESGRLTVDISDESLRQLERGEPIDFHGRAVRADGAERRIEGRATPLNATSGKLKVRVFYSKRIELIFNTSYRFTDAHPARHE